VFEGRLFLDMGVKGFDSIAQGKLQAELLTPKTNKFSLINANDNTAPVFSTTGNAAGSFSGVSAAGALA